MNKRELKALIEFNKKNNIISSCVNCDKEISPDLEYCDNCIMDNNSIIEELDKLSFKLENK